MKKKGVVCRSKDEINKGKGQAEVQKKSQDPISEALKVIGRAKSMYSVVPVGLGCPS